MIRIWIYLLIAAVWFCLAITASVAMDDPVYLAWAVFLPPSLALLNALRPRRGSHYVYWNRYIAVIGALLFGLGGVPFLVGYLSWWIKPLGRVFETFFGPWLVACPIVFLLWFKFIFMPSWVN